MFNITILLEHLVAILWICLFHFTHVSIVRLKSLTVRLSQCLSVNIISSTAFGKSYILFNIYLL